MLGWSGDRDALQREPISAKLAQSLPLAKWEAKIGIFSNIFGGGSAKRASLAAQVQQAQAQQKSEAALDTGYNTAKDYLTQAGSQYDPYAKYGSGYSDMYANATGVNGQPGADKATAAFQTGPGYQFAQDQGLQGILRAASAGGNLASGNTLAAASNFNTGLANQYYQQWLDNLRSGLSSSFAGSQGKAGTLGQIGQYGYQLGQDKAGVNQHTADNISGLIGSAAQAKMNGASNLFGAITGGLNALLGNAGGIFKLFGGGSPSGVSIGNNQLGY